MSQGGFYASRNEDGRVYIGDTSLRNEMPKNINPTINRNKITCGYEIFISAMLFQYDLNKWRLTQLDFLKSCISTRNQPGFYKYIRNIMMNTRIKYYQINVSKPENTDFLQLQAWGRSW